MQHGIARGRTIDSHARLGTTATRERHERPRPPRVGRRQPRLHITPGSKQQCRPQAIDHHWRRRQATTAHGEQWLHSGGGQPQPGGAQRHRPRCEQRRRHAQPLSRLRQQQQPPWQLHQRGQPQPGGAQRHRPRCEHRQEQRRRHAQPLSRLRQPQQPPWQLHQRGRPQPGGAQRHRPRCEHRQEQRHRHAQPLSWLWQQQQPPQWSSWRQLRRPQPPRQASGRQLRQPAWQQLRQPRSRIL